MKRAQTINKRLRFCLGVCLVINAGVTVFASSVEVLEQNTLTNRVLSDTVPILFTIGEHPDALKTVSLQIDGRIFRGDGAVLASPLPIPACFQMDTCYLENGIHTLQIEACWLNPNQPNSDVYQVHRSRVISISVTNDIYYPDWEREVGETGFSAYFLKTIHTNADWHIDIYDVRSNFVQRLSGHTMDGKIEAFWHMKDAKGVMRTNDALDPEFSSVTTVEDGTNKWTK